MAGVTQGRPGSVLHRAERFVAAPSGPRQRLPLTANPRNAGTACSSSPSYASPFTSADIDDQSSLPISSTTTCRNLAGSWILFCALSKIRPYSALASQLAQRFAIVLLQFDALHVRGGKVRPAVADGDGLHVVGEPRAFVGHFEEQQERQLLQILLVREPVVAQHIAVRPQFLDDAVRGVRIACGDGSRRFQFRRRARARAQFHSDESGAHHLQEL